VHVSQKNSILILNQFQRLDPFPILLLLTRTKIVSFNIPTKVFAQCWYICVMCYINSTYDLLVWVVQLPFMSFLGFQKQKEEAFFTTTTTTTPNFKFKLNKLSFNLSKTLHNFFKGCHWVLKCLLWHNNNIFTILLEFFLKTLSFVQLLTMIFLVENFPFCKNIFQNKYFITNSFFKKISQKSSQLHTIWKGT
jgi:hypothetical protein